MSTNAIALSRLLLAERPLLLRLAQRIVGSMPAAEDVTQSLWFRVLRIEDDPPIVNKRAYLYRLATNLATDQARFDRRHAALFESGELPEIVPDGQPSAERSMLDRENLETVLAALDELPPRVREIFIMRKFDGMPVHEIAERLGLSRSSIAKMLQRALLHCDARLHDAHE
ncbi:RNA polymerase sigma factor [Sandaracinobacter sp. RS1-74]|uniref:RNA polymerase sigma factor n=1 Tax=Sandaracinobacteroides sayramensis TaxID=2913411 RepID=UPI001EDC308B|nr:RNA polymerase sigma factor [Sandaracinobacteroides sayramensis]MCG2840134.1 RNA polymerase sigma factor [Sandaracinobacteroides sayramensis]